MNKEIASCFSSVVGQSQIVANRILSHSAFAAGNNSPYSVCYTGAAGLGKTQLLRAELAARAKAIEIRFQREANVFMLRSPQEIRLAGEAFFEFIGNVSDGDGVVIDELHEIEISSTVQLRKLKLILKGLLDNGQGKIRSVKIDDDTVISRPKEEIFFAAGTNFPEKIKDGSAIISRFGGETPLDLYTEDELTKILKLMSESAGLRVNENTLLLLAKCGRGTARPLESIVSYLSKVASISEKTTINRAEALEAMRALSLFPLGVSKREISILIRSKGQGLAVRMLPVIFAVEPKSVNQSVSFLCAYGFLSLRGGVVNLSPRGAAYLEQLKAEKFSLES
jgi:Holliday junction resolvasome RuvABC ATP-dependent DNA helicase subunit